MRRPIPRDPGSPKLWNAPNVRHVEDVTFPFLYEQHSVVMHVTIFAYLVYSTVWSDAEVRSSVPPPQHVH